MSAPSSFIKDKKTLMLLIAHQYSNKPGDELTENNWVITSIAPRLMPVLHWYSHFVHFEMRCIQDSTRPDFWHFDVLEITDNLSAVVLSGEKGNKNIPSKLYLYDVLKVEAIPLPGNAFSNLPWYYIAKVFWDKWGYLLIYLAIFVIVVLFSAW